MIKNIIRQFTPPIVYSAIQKTVLKKNSESKYAPHWYIIKNGILKGREFFVDPKCGAWQKEIIDGEYDQFFFDYLDKLNMRGKPLPIEGATIWDVGAHIGYHSLAFAVIVGLSGHVVAFEPNPYNAERFRQNLERNNDLGKHIALITRALGNVDGDEDFIFSAEIDGGKSSGSHLKQAFAPEETEIYQSFNQEKVPVVTADTLLRDGHIPPPSIIKIDVEGAESLVLAGAQYLLRSLRPVLLMEVHHIRAMHDTLNTLLRVGYRTSIINQAPSSNSRCFIVALPEESVG